MGALRSLWCCLGVSAAALMNTTAESTFLASSFLEIRLQGSRLPAQPAQLRNVNLQAPREGSPPPRPSWGHSSPISFRAQLKCHLLREALPDHPI